MVQYYYKSENTHLKCFCPLETCLQNKNLYHFYKLAFLLVSKYLLDTR